MLLLSYVYEDQAFRGTELTSLEDFPALEYGCMYLGAT